MNSAIAAIHNCYFKLHVHIQKACDSIQNFVMWSPCISDTLIGDDLL